MLLLYMLFPECCVLMSFRLSVRAFTQLFDEDKNDFSVSSPLFTDTYLSLPVVTEAGKEETSCALQTGWNSTELSVY